MKTKSIDSRLLYSMATATSLNAEEPKFYCGLEVNCVPDLAESLEAVLFLFSFVQES